MSRHNPCVRNFALTSASVLVLASLTACGGGALGDGGGESTEADCETYPNEEISMVVGRAPGGGYDEYARYIAPLLEKELGEAVVVENVDGAGGAVAASQVTSAAPDGYTIHVTEPNGLGALQTVDDVDYDITDFTMLGTVNNRASVFAVAADSDIRTFADLVAAGKDEPLTIAANGLTSANFVNAAIAADEAGFELTPVSHESSSEAITSVVRGDTDFTMFSSDSIYEAVETGDLRALAQFGEKPYEPLAGVPMADEVGLESLQGELTSTLIMVAPPEMPDCIREDLSDAVQKVLNGDEMAEFAAEGRIVEPASPEATQQTVEESLETYERYADSFHSYMD